MPTKKRRSFSPMTLLFFKLLTDGWRKGGLITGLDTVTKKVIRSANAFENWGWLRLCSLPKTWSTISSFSELAWILCRWPQGRGFFHSYSEPKGRRGTDVLSLWSIQSHVAKSWSPGHIEFSIIRCQESLFSKSTSNYDGIWKSKPVITPAGRSLTSPSLNCYYPSGKVNYGPPRCFC